MEFFLLYVSCLSLPLNELHQSEIKQIQKPVIQFKISLALLQLLIRSLLQSVYLRCCAPPQSVVLIK